jgi:DNA polymerase-1
VYARLEEVARKKLRETLAQYKDQALVSQHLVTLKSDVPLSFDLAGLRFERTPTPELRALYAELGFQRHLATLDARSATEARAATEGPARRAAKGTAAAPTARDNETSPRATDSAPPAELFQSPAGAFSTSVITQYQECAALLLTIEPQQQVSLALALDGDFPMTASWVGVALSLRPEHAVYLPLGHRYVGAPQQLSVAEAVRFLNELLAKDVQVGAFDGESTQVILQRHGVNLKTTAFDALISSYLLELDTAHELPRLVQGQLGSPLPSFPLPEKRTAKPLLVETREVAQVADVVGARAEALQRLWLPLSTRLEEEELRPVYDLDRPLSDLLAEVEQFGILLDVEQLRKLGREVGSQLLELERTAHQLLGREFNVNSPRQLETILFDELGLKPLKRTKTSRSTDAETLEALADEHALPKHILEIRQLAKLKGTYIDALPLLVNPHTGRLHTHWHQEIAATGRLSSTDPNLQNIPIRTELGKRIRQAFIAKSGHQLISADYSQIELRVLAHLSKDQTLLDAFRNGQDIHLRTAMEIFEVPEAEVTSELRRRAKAVNFGVIYGQGDGALSKSLGISRSDAGQFIAAYFRRYSGVTQFMQDTLQHARASSSVRTLLGRRRLVPDIHSGNRATRLAVERVVMNTPIQGTAADLLKLAMLKFKEPVTPGARMLLSVHDELVFEVPDAEVEAATPRIRERMENVYKLDVPLVVDVGVGSNWREAH